MLFDKKDDVKLVIEGFYREILGRATDTGGAQAYESLLCRMGTAEAISEMLRSFLGSPEYRERIRRAAPPFPAYEERLLNGRPVRHIASLGPYCLASTVLKGNGLKRYSLPFDWLFSNAEIVKDCLADDSATFLDRRHYSSTEHLKGMPSEDHRLFHQRYGTKYMFAHRDPTHDDDYQYFLRCVERFRRLLRSEDGKLFLIFGRWDHELPQKFSGLIEALGRAMRNFALIAVGARGRIVGCQIKGKGLI